MNYIKSETKITVAYNFATAVEKVNQNQLFKNDPDEEEEESTTDSGGGAVG